MGAKTCLNCIHGSKVINEGAYFFENPIKNYQILCANSKSLEDIGKENNWNELQMPKFCGRYQPKMVKQCAYCKSPINKEEYLWDHWAGIKGKPVCSYDCQVKLEAAEIGNLFSD